MNTLLLFCAVSLVSTATPGPAVLYVSSQGVLRGMQSAVPAALGVLLADALYIVLSVTGLSAVLAASYTLFSIIKWAGGAYLVYLGMRLLLSALSSKEAPVAAAPLPISNGRSLIGGFAVHAANPKALLYFGSLVPQFVDPTQPLGPQLAALAIVHLVTAASVLFVYAAVSSRFRRSAASRRVRCAFSVAAGSTLVGAGISLALLRKTAQ